MLDQATVLPGEGTMVLVDATVTDTLRRLRDGDNVLGWEGDPNMQLMVDRTTRLFDVWTLDPAGNATLVVGQRPYADSRLVEDVIRADNRRSDVIGRIIQANADNQRAARDRFRDQMAEAHDKLHFALLKDIGHLEGGLTRRLH